MAILSGFLGLVTAVQTYFAANSVTASVVVGWKERGKQINQGAGGANRVVFTPSDDAGGGGAIKGPSQPGGRVQSDGSSIRSLRNWERTTMVSIWACDTTDLQNEGLQIAAVENLFEWTVRAVNSYAASNAVWGNTSWTVNPTEMAFGRELRAELAFVHPIYATPFAVAKPTPVIEPSLGEESP